MKAYLLFFSIVGFLAAESCQKRVQTAGPAQIKDTSIKTGDEKALTPQPANSTIKAINGILIKVEPERIKSSNVGKVKLTITNSTTENVTTGTYYRIESYEGTFWKKLNLLDKIVFEDIAFNINPSSSKEFIIDLQLIPYNYIPGKYRIGKEVVSGGQRLIVSSEFTVE